MEHGLIDLDAPANDYLRAYRLVPAKASFRPATVRHLLTHTAGIGEVLPPGACGGRDFGESVPVGSPVPSLAEYYRRGLRPDVEPGTRWTYTNHGFATLGQIVEDASGKSFDRYLREHTFESLGMTDTDLVRSALVTSHLATGYIPALRSRQRSPRPRDGDGGSRLRLLHAYSTTNDMARYVAALPR